MTVTIGPVGSPLTPAPFAMTTATRIFEESSFSRTSDVPVQSRVLGPSKSDGGGLFLLCSFGVHALGLVVFSSLPGPAYAAVSPTQEIEIFLHEEVATETLPDAVTEEVPLGRLDTPVPATPVPPHRLHKSLPVTDTINPPPQQSPQAQPSAPAVLTSNNPYASSNAVAFTSGTESQGNTKVVVASAGAAPRSGFGVESGSEHFSKEKAAALSAWHRKVRGQLASLASRSYPKRAQHLGQEGTTKITVQIASDGRILSASLQKGSGHGILDRAALSGIRSIRTVAAPPAGVGSTRLTIPVNYRLR